MINYRNGDADGALKRLHEELLQPLPFTLTGQRLYQIFNMQNNATIDYRGGTTFLDNGLITNRGKASQLQFNWNTRWKHGRRISVQIDIPSLLQGSYTRTGRDFQIRFTNFGETAKFSFSNVLADARFGGQLVQIDASDTDVIATTRGCVQIPLQQSMLSTFSNRLTKTLIGLAMFEAQADLDGLRAFGVLSVTLRLGQTKEDKESAVVSAIHQPFAVGRARGRLRAVRMKRRITGHP